VEARAQLSIQVRQIPPNGVYLITGFGTAPMLQRPELEAFTRCCSWEATQTYSLYFKCLPTKQMLSCEG